MKYHNIRDASGRFISSLKKKTTKKTTKKAAEKQRIISFYLLDNTGSMQSKRNATVEGFNSVLTDSRKADKENSVDSKELMALFGGVGKFQLNSNINFLSTHSYNPNEGSTAIYANIIKAINELDKIVAPEDKVVLTIFTDGENNDGYSYQESCKKLITEKNIAGWVINFVGAGDQLFVEQIAKSISISTTNTLSYNNTAAGTAAAFDTLAASRGLYSTSVKEKKDKNIGFFAKK